MKGKFVSVVVILMFVFMAGCSKAQETPAPAAQASEAPAQSANESPAATEAPAAAPTDAPAGTMPEATAVVITHLVTPGEATYKTDQKVSDCNTGERVRLGATTLIGNECDTWEEQKLERPAAATNGPYAAALDITSAWMGTNQQWMFAKLVLYETNPANLPADFHAGFEIDTDLDSRGEYLIIVSGVPTTEWSTDGVQVWQDSDGQVGGSKPHRADTSSGNGYETLVFDGGLGDDPDLAWVRLNRANGLAVEFAFKPTLVPANQVFAWWGWTFGGGFDPAKMEVVDLLQNSATWMVDNTCAWIFNAKPTNLQINICPFQYPTAIPTITPTMSPQGCPAGTYLDQGVCRTCQIPPVGGCPSSAATWNPSTCRCENIN
jgi:hypothetical protein